MIAALTPAQEARFQEYIDRWTAIGLSTAQANRPAAEAGVRLAYQAAGLVAPSKFIWFDSPLSMGLTHYAISQSWNRLGQHTGASVWASVGDSVRDSVRTSVRTSVRAIVYGQHEVSWLVFYAYMDEVLGLRAQCAPLDGLRQVCEHAGWWMPFADACFLSERHTTLRRDARGRLHCEDGLACGYPDGWGIYAWHGVRVPEAVILLPAEAVTKAHILQEQNAEVRRVLVDKVGIERVCQLCEAQTVDTQGDYALLLLDLGDRRRRPYLKMRNPSIGVWHVEGVHPSVTTVQQALNWRASGDKNVHWEPEVLT